MKACQFLRRVLLPDVRDIFLSRLLWLRSASMSAGRYSNVFNRAGFFDHLSPYDHGFTLGGNSVKVLKQFREGPGRVLGRSRSSTIYHHSLPS